MAIVLLVVVLLPAPKSCERHRAAGGGRALHDYPHRGLDHEVLHEGGVPLAHLESTAPNLINLKLTQERNVKCETCGRAALTTNAALLNATRTRNKHEIRKKKKRGLGSPGTTARSFTVASRAACLSSILAMRSSTSRSYFLSLNHQRQPLVLEEPQM